MKEPIRVATDSPLSTPYPPIPLSISLYHLILSCDPLVGVRYTHHAAFQQLNEAQLLPSPLPLLFSS